MEKKFSGAVYGFWFNNTEHWEWTFSINHNFKTELGKNSTNIWWTLFHRLNRHSYYTAICSFQTVTWNAKIILILFLIDHHLKIIFHIFYILKVEEHKI